MLFATKISISRSQKGRQTFQLRIRISQKIYPLYLSIETRI